MNLSFFFSLKKEREEIYRKKERYGFSGEEESGQFCDEKKKREVSI